MAEIKQLEEQIQSFGRSSSHMNVVFTSPASQIRMAMASNRFEDNQKMMVVKHKNAPVNRIYFDNDVAANVLDIIAEQLGTDNTIVVANKPHEKGAWTDAAQANGMTVYDQDQYDKMAKNWGYAVA